MKRIVAFVLAALLAANGVAMLLAGPWWYGAVPGVTATGPYNPHFVKDIGAAYLASAAGLAWRGPAAAVAAAFLVLHAFIHVFDAARSMHGGADLVRDLPGVFLPAALAVWIAWPIRRTA